MYVLKLPSGTLVLAKTRMVMIIHIHHAFYMAYWINVINYVNVDGPAHNSNAKCVHCLTCFGFRTKAVWWHSRCLTYSRNLIGTYSTAHCHNLPSYAAFNKYAYCFAVQVRSNRHYFVYCICDLPKSVDPCCAVGNSSTYFNTPSAKAVNVIRLMTGCNCCTSYASPKSAWRTGEGPLSTKDTCHVNLKRSSSTRWWWWWWCW